MKFEQGAGNIKYEYHSASAQMVRELRKQINNPKKLEGVLETLRAVNVSAFDRGALFTLRQVNKIAPPERPAFERPRLLCPKHLNQFRKGV